MKGALPHSVRPYCRDRGEKIAFNLRRNLSISLKGTAIFGSWGAQILIDIDLYFNTQEYSQTSNCHRLLLI